MKPEQKQILLDMGFHQDPDDPTYFSKDETLPDGRDDVVCIEYDEDEDFYRMTHYVVKGDVTEDEGDYEIEAHDSANTFNDVLDQLSIYKEVV